MGNAFKYSHEIVRTMNSLGVCVKEVLHRIVHKTADKIFRKLVFDAEYCYIGDSGL